MAGTTAIELRPPRQARGPAPNGSHDIGCGSAPCTYGPGPLPPPLLTALPVAAPGWLRSVHRVGSNLYGSSQ
eukprot:CAMPEP_0119489724 /NCGR_PEP_ID=MMETSP1344-20130328/15093_1 /TAXON_ID=236787 /ORGANISM="Florenciella parvula, Strain CCMP2471" /LENGTH=71 /DNA_ID=CAMNT_0007524801 /DNA_START=92 /DNA_END=307 /DNA_ORIENTATION=-